MPATHRVDPVSEPYDAATAEALRRLMGGAEVPPLLLFRTLARHPQLLDRFRQIGSTLLGRGTLEPGDRETLIHRTTARCGAAYEWSVHAALFAPALGLGEAWLRATWAGGAEDPAFTPRQALLVRIADALHDDGRLDDGLHAELAATWPDPATQVEIVCVAGFYHLVSFLCGAFALPAEPWAVAPPS